MFILTIFFIIPGDIENAGLKHALSIPTGAPVANDAIEMLPLVAQKQLKFYQNIKKKKYIY